jgi:hypothetical protein
MVTIAAKCQNLEHYYIAPPTYLSGCLRTRVLFLHLTSAGWISVVTAGKFTSGTLVSRSGPFCISAVNMSAINTWSSHTEISVTQLSIVVDRRYYG